MPAASTEAPEPVSRYVVAFLTVPGERLRVRGFKFRASGEDTWGVFGVKKRFGSRAVTVGLRVEGVGNLRRIRGSSRSIIQDKGTLQGP